MKHEVVKDAQKRQEQNTLLGGGRDRERSVIGNNIEVEVSSLHVRTHLFSHLNALVLSSPSGTV